MTRTGYESCNNAELYACESYYQDLILGTSDNDPEQDVFSEELHFILIEQQNRDMAANNVFAIMNH